MSFGEMTITLDDVRVLLGINVTSKTVVVKSKERIEVTLMVSRLLGISISEIDEEIKTMHGLTIRLAWLKERFSVPSKRLLEEEESEEEEDEEVEEGSDGNKEGYVYPPVECLVRAYILNLIGATPFANKSGIRVPLTLIQFLEDVDIIGSYAWGGATLAYMYR
ncbi:hypothetical protein Scep_029673 [Stephania cephalantha]|uniref:Aminotransferase-like plant mobile domain-containing protein n=1 Tax=Stephania cephalantha TaxID=152367 RepID=A0AAP0HFU8_9MAGN